MFVKENPDIKNPTLILLNVKTELIESSSLTEERVTECLFPFLTNNIYSLKSILKQML